MVFLEIALISSIVVASGAIIKKLPKVSYHVRVHENQAAPQVPQVIDPWGKNCPGNERNGGRCWEEMVDSIIMMIDGSADDKESMMKPNNRTLRHLSFKLAARGPRADIKVLLYYTEITHTEQCGDVSMEWFEGSSSVMLNQLHTLPKMTLKHKHWCDLMGKGLKAHAKVGDALWDLYLPVIPRAGGPQKPHKLFETRLQSWEGLKEGITLYRINSTESVLPAATSGVTALTIGEIDGAEMREYITASNEAKICLMDAVMLNYIGIGGKSSGKTFFKAISAPTVSSQQVYYTFPGALTNAMIMAGIQEPYMQHINTVVKKSAADKTHKIAQMFASWGYTVLKDVQVKSNGTVNNDKHYLRFMYPGGYQDTSVHDDVMQNVRDDLELIAKMMTEQKKANAAAGSGSRVQLPEIDNNLFKFFGKSGPKPGNYF